MRLSGPRDLLRPRLQLLCEQIDIGVGGLVFVGVRRGHPGIPVEPGRVGRRDTHQNRRADHPVGKQGGTGQRVRSTARAPTTENVS